MESVIFPDLNKIYCGDSYSILKTWPDSFVNTVVTSPPYYNLRSYGDIEEQVGVEETPEKYVSRLVEIFREVRRVLKNDGVLWLVIGDSYWGINGYARANKKWFRKGRNDAAANNRKLPKHDRLKVKDLIGIPWMVAFALQRDGWYLRSDIIWQKPNAMPSSVTDRCSSSHEYIFMLTKSSRYYFNSEAIREPAVCAGQVVTLGEKSFSKRSSLGGNIALSGNSLKDTYTTKQYRNKRDVWSVSTQPFKGSHYATYPPKLITPCILATSRPEDIVLDPFVGAGTTAVVAKSLGRQFIGCELNPDYVKMASKRIDSEVPLFTPVEIK